MLGEKCAVKFADEIIVLSEGVKQYFQDTYGRKTRFIPNGVNKPEIKSAELITEKYGLTKDSYILFLGRLVPEKGIRYLIEAFKDVQTDKKLVIAGGSSDTDEFANELKELAKGDERILFTGFVQGIEAFKDVQTDKKLVIAGGSSDTDEFANELKELAKGDERILFTGFVQGQVLEELYSNAYVYTLPSDLEGMPLSLLEAMSYGNCCLVSDILECTEVVEDKALVFTKSDVNDLKEHLQAVCNHSEVVKELKNKAADFICKKYNWDEIVQKTLTLYRGDNE